MKRFSSALRFSLMLLVATVLLAGCGLFGGAEREREQENEAIQGVSLGDVVTAEGIGENNAPVGVTDSFNASQDFIYVVAEADSIEQDTSMYARWSRDGEPFEDSAEITADQDYRDTYVEFHLENLEGQFEEGNYSVQIFVNGNPTDEVEFTIE
jgi:hypothetical protein